MKICSICKINKNLNDFHIHRWNNGYYSSCKICRKKQSRQDYQKRKETIKKATLQYHYNNLEKRKIQRRVYQNKRIQSDPIFKLQRNLRNRLWYALDHKMWKKNTKFAKYIGLIDFNDLKLYLELKFQKNMTWDNYGSYWEIDHIIPLSSAKTEEELIKLSHYTNLQPLTILENRAKKNKTPHCAGL